MPNPPCLGDGIRRIELHFEMHLCGITIKLYWIRVDFCTECRNTSVRAWVWWLTQLSTNVIWILLMPCARLGGFGIRPNLLIHLDRLALIDCLLWFDLPLSLVPYSTSFNPIFINLSKIVLSYWDVEEVAHTPTKNSKNKPVFSP